MLNFLIHIILSFFKHWLVYCFYLGIALGIVFLLNFRMLLISLKRPFNYI